MRFRPVLVDAALLLGPIVIGIGLLGASWDVRKSQESLNQRISQRISPAGSGLVVKCGIWNADCGINSIPNSRFPIPH